MAAVLPPTMVFPSRYYWLPTQILIVTAPTPLVTGEILIVTARIPLVTGQIMVVSGQDTDGYGYRFVPVVPWAMVDTGRPSVTVVTGRY
ncbi:hypothetical protein L484_028027 [Morus notabilis]|uniref:Uncharacterized protein n=1 Tax=Morus notabilis TaxID=981085 RepID=W9SFX0_9ROSA|nr:hypothetical protein L484_028027 [Morus notabilis]